MNVVYSLDGMSRGQDVVVTVGSFDGVHLGHRAILKAVIDRAAARDGSAVVVTFDPHPREVLGRGPVEYLNTLTERLDKLESIGVGTTVVVRFTYEFSRLSAEEFYANVLLPSMNLREVIVGHDHQFGKDRAAGFAEIQRLGSVSGFTAQLVEPVLLDGAVISSSAIRGLLREGNVERAAGFLGYHYALSGRVVPGQGRGRTIGFPTANIEPDAGKAIPANGVYVVRAESLNNGNDLYGMMNIGVRPTFETDGQRSLEVHFPGFDGDLYGRNVRLSFLRYLRAERKFSSKDELIAQLQRDRESCLAGVAEFTNSPMQ